MEEVSFWNTTMPLQYLPETQRTRKQKMVVRAKQGGRPGHKQARQPPGDKSSCSLIHSFLYNWALIMGHV